MAPAAQLTATLVYNAAKELLTGTIGTERPFHMRVYSGGSRGHSPTVSPKKAADYLHGQSSTLASRLATTITKEVAGKYVQRGGTLPPGHYLCQYIAHHATFGECIWLSRRSDAMAIHSPFSRFPIPHGRGNDFYIHGRGAKGSDGCLVPENQSERLRLNKAVKNFGGHVLLEVINVGYQLPAELEPDPRDVIV